MSRSQNVNVAYYLLILISVRRTFGLVARGAFLSASQPTKYSEMFGREFHEKQLNHLQEREQQKSVKVAFLQSSFFKDKIC